MFYKQIAPIIFMKNKLLVTGLSMVKVANEFSEKHPKYTPTNVIDVFKHIGHKRAKKENSIQNSVVYQTHIKYTKALSVA